MQPHAPLWKDLLTAFSLLTIVGAIGVFSSAALAAF